MTDFAYGFRRRMPSGELDGLSLEQLDWNVEIRDVDCDAGAYIARRRRTHENVAERKDVARDAQRCSVSLREAAEGEPAEIVSNVILEAGDDRHKVG